jgi:hypothetical protein
VGSVPSGVVLKEHTRLTDHIADDITEAYTPIQFISARTKEFESRVQDGIFDFVYAGKAPEGLAEELSAELAEAMSGEYSDGSLHH